ncbi:MAG: hypothetical protein HON62_01650 [Rhodospirillaceae bacterium]|jgi:hypothetical protein|nr:hypothetical protein [Rhodospirillaceae bacterium]
MAQPSRRFFTFKRIEFLSCLPHPDAGLATARRRPPGAVRRMLTASFGEDAQAFDYRF